jgi:hypothetical protein
MSTVENKTVPAMPLRTMQIIQFALIAGVTAFAGYVLLVHKRPQGAPDMNTVWILAGLGGFVILQRLFVPSLIARNALRQIAAGTWNFGASRAPGPPVPPTDEAKLVTVYQTKMIIGSALLEGGAFANLLGAMLSGHMVSWILSAVLWLGMIIDFPTRGRVERWVESKLAWIRDERRLSGRPT